APVGGVGGHGDLLGRQAVVVDQVLAGALGAGDHARGAPGGERHEGIQQDTVLEGEETRVAPEGDVVDGGDEGDRPVQGRDVLHVRQADGAAGEVAGEDEGGPPPGRLGGEDDRFHVRPAQVGQLGGLGGVEEVVVLTVHGGE